MSLSIPQQSAAAAQPDAVEQRKSSGALSRFFAKFKRSDARDDGSSKSLPARETVELFGDMVGGARAVGVAQQLKLIKDADAAAAAQKAKEAEEKRKLESGEVDQVNTQILPADIDRWMPDHWLRSQYLEEMYTGTDTDLAARNRMVQLYVDEEKIVSKNASTAFKFGFSKAVRMKMEQDANAAQRLADYEKMKEAMRNRLDTATVFDVKHDFFCRGLPANSPDYLHKVKLLSSNWFQRLFMKPPGSSATTFATVALVGARKTRMDWGAVFCPRGAGANHDGLGFIYMGSLEGGIPHTYGEIHFENGDIYQGEFKGGRLTGCGKYWYRSVDEVTCGDFYEGYFLSSCKSGIGAYTFGTAKAKYIGEFVNNKFCGFGIYTSISETHRGTFVDDERHGSGVSVFNPINGCIKESLYVGDFKNGRRHGLGRLNFVNCSTYFGEFRNGHMHGIGALACFDGCTLMYGRWHLGKRHGRFYIKRTVSQDCQVILYDTDVPVWSRCIVSSDLLELVTPSVSVMVSTENLCTEIEAVCADKLLYFNARFKTISQHLSGDILDSVKACVEQARFHACQHVMFNIMFGISSDDIKVIRVDGERRNVYLRDYDMFNQGVDDDAAAAAAKDVTTTQKIARIVRRLQVSIAQGPEPEKIVRKSKAELQAEASAKAAEVASNDLEATIYQYGELLKKPQVQALDKLVLLLTALQQLPPQAKLAAEHVARLASMQSNEADSLKIIQHFMTASDTVNNFDHHGCTYVPSGPRPRGVRRKRKELIALPMVSFEKFRRLLQNIALNEALKDDALVTCEKVREWAYYCDLAEKNDLSRFRMYVNVRNHFAKEGKIVSPPVGALAADSTAFSDELARQYTEAMTRRAAQRSAPAGDVSDSSSSDNSVDFSLQLRRFLPLCAEEERAARAPAAEPRRDNAVVVISDSDSVGSSGDDQNAAAVSPAARGSQTSVAGASAMRKSRDAFQHVPRAPGQFLAFSPMKAGGVTQRVARAQDKLLHSSDSDDAK